MPEVTQRECNEDSGGFRKGCECERASLYYSAHAATTKHPDLGGLRGGISVLTVLAARSPRSRCGQGWFLLRPLSLVCRCPSSPGVFPWVSLCVCVCVCVLISLLIGASVTRD